MMPTMNKIKLNNTPIIMINIRKIELTIVQHNITSYHIGGGGGISYVELGDMLMLSYGLVEFQ